MADIDRPSGREPATGGSNTTIVAIAVIILLAVVAFFIFMRPGTIEVQEGPDVELEVEPPADSDAPAPDGGGNGTGGDEGQFLRLARDLVPSATIVSPRGDVSEHGAARFFRRTEEGVYDLPDLDLYYQDCVIGGRGAFMVVARDFSSFAAAIKQKLFLEIAGLDAFDYEAQASALGFALPVTWARKSQGPLRRARFDGDCQIGERQSHEFWRFRQTFPD